MAKDTLPERTNAYRFAEAKAKIKGVLPIQEMERLQASLVSNEGQAAVEFNFGVDDQHVPFMTSKVEAELKLQCQRCMEVFSLAVTADLAFAFIKTEAEINHLPERYEPIVTEDGDISVRDVVEDELIISLPIVPMHNPEDCKVRVPNILLSSESSETFEKRINPFKVIETLRTKQK